MENRYENRIVTLPNALTLFRVLLIPVFVWLYGSLKNHVWSAAVLGFSALTDLADGWIARHFRMESNLGRILDPVADKLMTITALYCFYVDGTIDWLFLTIVVGKELAMVVGGYVMLTYRIVVYSKMCGKVAAVLFYLAIVMTFFPSLTPWNQVVLYAAMALMLYSLAFYFKDGLSQMRKRKAEGKTFKGETK